MANTKKQTLVSDLITLLNEHTHFVIVGFDKTPHMSMEKLRRELKKNGSHMTVVKNTLFVKALRKFASEKKNTNLNVKALSDIKTSSAFLALGDDWGAGLKAFHTFAKQDKSVSFKIGFLDAKMYQSAEIEEIAKLPSKIELLGQLIGSMKSPLYHTVYAMKFNMQQFVGVLSEASKKAN